MKHKVFAFLLALSVMSWAQTAIQNSPAAKADPNQPDQKKAACICCEKGSGEAKDGASCCRHHDAAAKSSKEAMSCCAGKDAGCCRDGAACKRGDQVKADAANCKDCCKHEAGKSCCMEKEKSAMKCCGADRCGRHSDASAGE
jgi:hypothetical protein